MFSSKYLKNIREYDKIKAVSIVLEDVVKYCKRFAEGMGYIACFLALIFIIFTYFEFGEPVLDEETGITTTFLDERGVKEYIALFGMTLVTLIICALTDKIPFIGALVSFAPLYSVFSLFADEKLVFCPTMIMILTLMLVAGELVATGQWIRNIAKKI